MQRALGVARVNGRLELNLQPALGMPATQGADTIHTASNLASNGWSCSRGNFDRVPIAACPRSIRAAIAMGVAPPRHEVATAFQTLLRVAGLAAIDDRHDHPIAITPPALCSRRTGE